MIFSDNIDKNEYEEFVLHNKDKAHFLQSKNWGEFQEKVNNRKAYFTGVYKDNKLVATCLLLERKLPLGYSYMYAPRGPILNFEDTDTLDFLINNLKAFAKKKRAIYIKFDPNIIIKKENYLEEPLKIDMDTGKLFKHLTEDLKLKHLGFTKNFETEQPRFTYRIDLELPEEDIYSRFNKKTQQALKKTQEIKPLYTKNGVKAIDDFYSLMLDTENRKDFVGHDNNYYKKMFDYFDDISIYFAYIEPQKLITMHEDKIKELNNLIKETKDIPKNKGKLKEYHSQLLSNETNLKIYQEALENYGEKILLNSYFIMTYAKKSWTLYAGNRDYLQKAGSNIGLAKYTITDAKRNGIAIYDHFGAVDKESSNDYLLGINNFKKAFGGDYIEFIGEFDLIANKTLYFLFTKLLPIYRKIVHKKLQKQNKKRSN